MAIYGWTPRDIDELYIDELCEAHANVPRVRKQRIGDMAQSVRMAKLKNDQFSRALKDLYNV